MNFDTAILSIHLNPSLKTILLQSPGCHLLSSYSRYVGDGINLWPAEVFSRDTFYNVLLKPTDCCSAVGVRVYCCHSSLGALADFVKSLFGHCGPTVGADDYPVMLTIASPT